MAVLNVHEAKTQLSDLMARAERGEDIVIARNGKPVVRLVPICEEPSLFLLGSLKGKIQFAPGWDDPMKEEEIAAWYTAPIFPENDGEEASDSEPAT